MSDEKKEEVGISMMDMLKAGVHFGHKKSRRNPKMKDYIYTVRNGISIIDLGKTKSKLNEALEYVKEISSKGGIILFIGTKKQAKRIVQEEAERCNMPYVTERWLGGTFTNFNKIVDGIKRFEKMIEDKESEEFEKKYTKKERLEFDREIKRLEVKFNGIREMKKLPDAVFVVDSEEESIAVSESNARNIPIIAMVDTNTDPTLVNYPIPSNDDAVGSIKLITNVVAEAIIEGKNKK
jgi:small subunit ribosomal protein S2